MSYQIRHADINACAAAATIHTPTLVAQDSRDELVRPAITRRLVDRLRGPVQLVEVPANHDLLVTPAWEQIEYRVLEFMTGFSGKQD
ncbi:MAG: hypothetical protein HZC41_25825 [Chloroflexi bacterium]|nr:hypothetical protein [Chloroflexota bacterium]